MGKKVITMSLDPSSIDQAIAEIDKYKAYLEQKALELQERLTNELASYVDAVFSHAIVEDRINKTPKYAEVQVDAVTATDTDGFSVVIARGEDAIWVEFGAGIYHNGDYGQSPNPIVAREGLPFVIGSMTYGKGGKAWGFYENGELILTHGTPASMPFYNGMEALCKEIDKIAQEVFAT